MILPRPTGSRRRAVIPLLVASLIVLIGRPARADVQAWSGLESRVPVSDGRLGLPTHARWVTESRFGGPREGLSLLLARLGPMWDLSPNVLLNLNGVQAVASDNAGVMRPESRIEVEPNLRGRLGALALNLRQRAELRWVSADPSYRYRAQLRATYQPTGAVLAPFASTELLVAMRGGRLESRNVLGISIFPTKNVRFDVGYMLRPRQSDEGWLWSHVGILTFTFAPQLAPIIDSGGG